MIRLLSGYLALVVVLFLSVPQRGAVVSKPLEIVNPVVSPTPTFRPLSIDEMLEYHEPRKKGGLISLLVTGDIMPGRSVNKYLRETGDFDQPFRSMSYLKEDDIVFVNLESPVTDWCETRLGGFKFCSDARIIPAMLNAGIDIANIANNHINNEGDEGVKQTIDLLQAVGIKVTGTSVSVKVNVRGKTFGFLGYNEVGKNPIGISGGNKTRMVEDIKKLDQEVDNVIVQFHWGVEYTNKPNTYQIDLAHAAIDVGADLVVGDHPHWVQGLEIYKDKLIAYSHGNFIFDQQWSKETQEGVVGEYLFNEKGLVDANFYPIVVDESFQPRFTNKLEAEEILERMRQGSQISIY